MLYRGNNRNLIEKIKNIKNIQRRITVNPLPYESNYINKNLSISTNYYNISNQLRKNYNNKNFRESRKLNKCSSLPNLGSIAINNNIIKRRIFLKVPRFNYSCCLDKNNLFCLKYKKPKENIKKKAIKMIFQLDNIKIKNQYKKPRMVKILENNNKIFNEVFSHPWKYREIFDE